MAQLSNRISVEDKRLLALWAAGCAEHVLPLFEERHPLDDRPRKAIGAARAWARGELPMMKARSAAIAAHAAAREGVCPAAEFAARAAGHAAAAAHSAGHAKGAAAYASKAVAAESAVTERKWQHSTLPNHLIEEGLPEHLYTVKVTWVLKSG